MRNATRYNSDVSFSYVHLQKYASPHKGCIYISSLSVLPSRKIIQFSRELAGRAPSAKSRACGSRWCVMEERRRVMHGGDREACRGSRARLEVRRQVDLLAWTGCTMVSGRRLEVGHLLLRFTLVSATRKESARGCPALSLADRAWISMF